MKTRGPMLAAALAIVATTTSPASATVCLGDINRDGNVDVFDLNEVLLNFGCGACPQDLDGDGEVGVSDVRIVVCAWGLCGAGPDGGNLFWELFPVDNSLGDADPNLNFAGGVTHFTYDLVVFSAGDTSFSSGECAVMIDDPGTTLFQYPMPFGQQNGAPPNMAFIPIAPALQYDSYFTAVVPGIPPGGIGDPNTTVTASFNPIGTPQQASAFWFNANNGKPDGVVARLTLVVPAGSGITPEFVPQGTGGDAVVLGSLHGNGFARGSCEVPQSFAFDIIDGGVDYQPPQEFAADSMPVSGAIGDIDGDGTLDAVVVLPGRPSGNGDIQVFLNQDTPGVSNAAAGAWPGLLPNTPETVGMDPTSVALGDFNDDTFLDVAVANAGSGDVTILLNDGMGTGTFVAGPTIMVTGELVDIVAADFNLDTVPDLAVANATAGELRIIDNDGLGGFSLGQAVPLSPGVTSLDPDDLDGDKCVDLVVADAGTDTVSVVLNTGGTFGVPLAIPVGADPVDVSIGDFDRDGLNDIATVNNAAGTVSAILNTGGGSFAAAVDFPVGAMPTSIDIAPVDCDAWDDIVIVATDPMVGTAVQVLLNLRPGVGLVAFEPPVTFEVSVDPMAAPADPNTAANGDFDGDGRLDVLSTNASSGPTGGSLSALLNSSACDCPTLNGDSDVNVVDLIAVVLGWGGSDADVTGDGVVDVLDLLEVILAWGPCPGFTFVCPGTTDCLVADDTPGCDDAGCCSVVCAQDFYCCVVEWDQICADEAYILCE